jgi:hypothetical protein
MSMKKSENKKRRKWVKIFDSMVIKKRRLRFLIERSNKVSLGRCYQKIT